MLISEDQNEITLEELSCALSMEPSFVVALVEYEVILPRGESQQEWKFNSICIRRARIAASFQRDLHLNLSGINLALDLLDQIEQLKVELSNFSK